MGNCGSTLDCIGTGEPIQSDPDIAGIGVRQKLLIPRLFPSNRTNAYLETQVLMSFLTTAIITVLAVIVGYLTESLPDSALIQLDHAFVDNIPTRKWWPWSKNGSQAAPFQPMITASTIVGLGGSRLDPDERSKRARERRIRGLQRFLLALSDQQLVTGMAIMIAGLMNQCSRSVYHFDIIAALGWFSSTTHLSTLTALQDHLINHPRTRDLRVVGMLCILGLQFVFQTGTFSTQENYLPVKCMWLYFWPEMPNIIIVIWLISVWIFLVSNYADKIGPLYTSDPDWTAYNWLLKAVTRLSCKGNRARNFQVIFVSSNRKSKAEKSAAHGMLRQRRRWFQYCGIWNGTASKRLVETMFLFQEFQRSFLSEISFSLFSLAYGITQVFIYRNSIPEAGLSGDQNTMIFGQLVPLLLLALPVLAAGELYFEQYNENDEDGTMAYKSENSDIMFFDPVASFMQEGSSLAIARTLKSSQSLTELLPSTLAVNKLDPSTGTINVHSVVPPAQMGGTRQPGASLARTMTDDGIQLVGRIDTETGLKFTQTSRAISSHTKGESQAPGPRDRTSISSPKAKDRRSRRVWITKWDTLCLLFFFQTSLLVFIAVCLTSALGDTASYVALFIMFIGFVLYVVEFVVEAALERKDTIEANVSMNAKSKKMNKGSLDR